MKHLKNAGKEVERKGLEVKLEGDKGDVRAVIATLNVIDKHGDLTEPGAFGQQDVLISAYNHGSWGGALPVGTGRVKEEGNEAIFEGKLFLDTTPGKDHYQTLKALQEAERPSEWSYGFDKVEWSYKEENDRYTRILKKVKVYEVSPVLLGAGENTRTLDVKGGMTFADELEAALAAVSGVGERSKLLAEMRRKDGRALGVGHVERLKKLLGEVKKRGLDLEALLDEVDDKATDDLDEKARGLYLQVLETQVKINLLEVGA